MRLLPALFACLIVAACSGQVDEAAETEAFNQRVHRYIVENPEVIEEAIIALQQRAMQQEQERLERGIAEFETDILNDPRDPVWGPADARVTIVEYFDYNCGACAAANEWLTRVSDAHEGDIRIIFKEFPILSERSHVAARAALAIWQLAPDRYFAFHNALMRESAPRTSDLIMEIAATSGVDPVLLEETMNSEEISLHLAETHEIANLAQIRATPTFIVNGQVVEGAAFGRLQQAVLDALERP